MDKLFFLFITLNYEFLVLHCSHFWIYSHQIFLIFPDFHHLGHYWHSNFFKLPHSFISISNFLWKHLDFISVFLFQLLDVHHWGIVDNLTMIISHFFQLDDHFFHNLFFLHLKSYYDENLAFFCIEMIHLFIL